MENCIAESGAINRIEEFARQWKTTSALIVGDVNTFSLAGDKIKEILEGMGIKTVSYIYRDERLEPDENAVGRLIFEYNNDIDLIVGIGSGVINDICKIISKLIIDQRKKI